jgi:ABC-type phosphate/phosphonate transport system permease subunit
MNKTKLFIALGILVVIVVAVILAITLSNKDTANTSTTSTLTMNDVISKFEEQGITVTLESKPAFALIGAKDGVMFYIDNSPVKLYEFESENSYKTALETYSILEKMPKKGLVVLDTNSQTAIDTFNSL